MLEMLFTLSLQGALKLVCKVCFFLFTGKILLLRTVPYGQVSYHDR